MVGVSRGVPGRLVRVGLRHDPAARAKAELQAVVARHDDVLPDKKVLPLAFHLLGASALIGTGTWTAAA